MKAIVAFAFFAVAAITPVHVHAQRSSKALDKYFDAYKYTALKPPVAIDSSNIHTTSWWRAGFVFVLDTSKKARSIGCPAVFSTATIDWLADESVSLKRKGSFSLIAKLLAAVGVVNQEASAEVGFSWDKHSNLEFADLKELQPRVALTKADIKKLGAGEEAKTNAIDLDPDCAASIRRHLNEKSHVYLVMSSIEAASFQVSVDDKSGFSAKADFSISTLVQLKPGIESKSETTTSIGFDETERPVRLAILTVPIKRARPTGEVSSSDNERNELILGAPKILDVTEFEFE